MLFEAKEKTEIQKGTGIQILVKIQTQIPIWPR